MTSPDPLDGPFMSARDLTDSGDPDFPIPPRDVAHRDVASDVLARLDRIAATGKAAA